MRRALLVSLVVLCAGCGGGKSAQPGLRGTALTPPVPAPDFVLHDQNGKSVSMAQDRGRYVVVTFLYTHCPDVCPVIAGNLNRVLATPTARNAGLRVIAVSVDPRGDTPAAVAAYVREHRLRPSFRFAIGDRAELSRVWSGYHVAAAPLPDGSVAHSTFEILVDPDGRERAVYDAAAKPADFVHDLAVLQGQG